MGGREPRLLEVYAGRERRTTVLIAGVASAEGRCPAAAGRDLERCLDVLGQAAELSGGRVVKRASDEVMALFSTPDAAAAAAARMQLGAANASAADIASALQKIEQALAEVPNDAEALALMAHATSRSFDVSTLGREIVDTLLLLLGCARATLFELIGSRVRLVAVARAHGVESQDDVDGLELGPVESQALRDRHLVATSDFLANGGDGVVLPAAARKVTGPVLTRDIVVSYVKEHSPITAELVGGGSPRITVVGRRERQEAQ